MKKYDDTEARQRWAAARQQAETLAQERGWRVSAARFTLRQLRTRSHPKWTEHAGMNCNPWGRSKPNFAYPEVDHAYFFREAVRPWRPAAVLSHSYANAAMCLAYAAENGLRAEIQPASGYNLGCIAVLYLPEAE
jgi:hypothetical protein